MLQEFKYSSAHNIDLHAYNNSTKYDFRGQIGGVLEKLTYKYGDPFFKINILMSLGNNLSKNFAK